jgi:hypothetical protein
VSDDEGRLDRESGPARNRTPVGDLKGWRKPLRWIWQTLRVLVQVNGVVQLVQNGESPVCQWAHEALNILLHVIRLASW